MGGSGKGGIGDGGFSNVLGGSIGDIGGGEAASGGGVDLSTSLPFPLSSLGISGICSGSATISGLLGGEATPDAADRVLALFF